MNFIQIDSTRINCDNIASYSPYFKELVGIPSRYGISIVYINDTGCRADISFTTKEARDEVMSKLDSMLNVKKL